MERSGTYTRSVRKTVVRYLGASHWLSCCGGRLRDGEETHNEAVVLSTGEISRLL